MKPTSPHLVLRLSVIVGAIVAGGIVLVAIFLYLSPPFPLQKATRSNPAFERYTNTEDHYTLDYPRSYTVSQSSSEFTDKGETRPWNMTVFVGENDTIQVITHARLSGGMDLGKEGTRMTIHGLPALFMTIEPPASDLPTYERVVIERPDGLVTEISGSGSAFKTLWSSFQFVP